MDGGRDGGMDGGRDGGTDQHTNRRRDRGRESSPLGVGFERELFFKTIHIDTCRYTFTVSDIAKTFLNITFGSHTHIHTQPTTHPHMIFSSILYTVKTNI